MAQFQVHALKFDVIGTLVDVRGSIRDELKGFAARFGLWQTW